MPLWFARGLRRGVVTTRYPARPDPFGAACLPTPPAFRPGRLTPRTAELLVAACPSRALRLQEKGDGPGGTEGGSPPCAEQGDGPGGTGAGSPPCAEQADGALIFDVGACTACGRCAQAAPDAVASSGEFELAATERPALVKRIPLRGEAR